MEIKDSAPWLKDMNRRELKTMKLITQVSRSSKYRNSELAAENIPDYRRLLNLVPTSWHGSWVRGTHKTYKRCALQLVVLLVATPLLVVSGY